MLLNWIGFPVVSVLPEPSNPVPKRERYSITTEPIRDQTLCPLPVFGSEANGRYQLVCYWDRPTEQDLSARAAALPNVPVIVLYFGAMSPQRRRDLARLRVEKRRAFLLIDDLTVRRSLWPWPAVLVVSGAP